MALTKSEQSLLYIQEIDLKLGQLKTQADSAPHKQHIAAARAKIAEGNKRLQLIDAARTDLQSKIDALELEVEEYAQKMQEASSKLQQSSNHREVNSYSKELEALVKQKEKRENEGMKLMERRAEFGLAHKDTAAKIESIQSAEAKEMAAYKKHFAALKVSHDELMQQRKLLEKNLDTELLANYEDIRKSKGGIGVSLYDEGKCGACQVMIPAAQRTEIETTGGTQICPSCKRLMIVES